MSVFQLFVCHYMVLNACAPIFLDINCMKSQFLVPVFLAQSAWQEQVPVQLQQKRTKVTIGEAVLVFLCEGMYMQLVMFITQ